MTETPLFPATYGLICYGYPELFDECVHMNKIMEKCKENHNCGECIADIAGCNGPYIACPSSPLRCEALHKNKKFILYLDSRGQIRIGSRDCVERNYPKRKIIFRV